MMFSLQHRLAMQKLQEYRICVSNFAFEVVPQVRHFRTHSKHPFQVHTPHHGSFVGFCLMQMPQFPKRLSWNSALKILPKQRSATTLWIQRAFSNSVDFDQSKIKRPIIVPENQKEMHKRNYPQYYHDVDIDKKNSASAYSQQNAAPPSAQSAQYLPNNAPNMALYGYPVSYYPPYYQYPIYNQQSQAQQQQLWPTAANASVNPDNLSRSNAFTESTTVNNGNDDNSNAKEVATFSILKILGRYLWLGFSFLGAFYIAARWWIGTHMSEGDFVYNWLNSNDPLYPSLAEPDINMRQYHFEQVWKLCVLLLNPLFALGIFTRSNRVRWLAFFTMYLTLPHAMIVYDVVHVRNYSSTLFFIITTFLFVIEQPLAYFSMIAYGLVQSTKNLSRDAHESTLSCCVSLLYEAILEIIAALRLTFKLPKLDMDVLLAPSSVLKPMPMALSQTVITEIEKHPKIAAAIRDAAKMRASDSLEVDQSNIGAIRVDISQRHAVSDVMTDSKSDKCRNTARMFTAFPDLSVADVFGYCVIKGRQHGTVTVISFQCAVLNEKQLDMSKLNTFTLSQLWNSPSDASSSKSKRTGNAVDLLQSMRSSLLYEKNKDSAVEAKKSNIQASMYSRDSAIKHAHATVEERMKILRGKCTLLPLRIAVLPNVDVSTIDVPKASRIFKQKVAFRIAGEQTESDLTDVDWLDLSPTLQLDAMGEWLIREVQLDLMTRARTFLPPQKSS